MPPHVVRHSRAVCTVALFLAETLAYHRVRLDFNLVRSAALLHDITKRYSFNRPLDHALTGSKLLKKLGYGEVASVIRQHVRLSKARPPGRITEAEIVNYSDKRVIEDRITTLAARIDYIKERYGRTDDALARIEQYAAVTFELEEDIFSVLPFEPIEIITDENRKEILKHERS